MRIRLTRISHSRRGCARPQREIGQQPAPAAHHAAPEQPRFPHEDDYSDTPAFLRTARQHDHSRYDDVLYDQNSQNAVHPQYADGQYQDGYQDQSDPNAYSQFYADGEQEEESRGASAAV